MGDLEQQLRTGLGSIEAPAPAPGLAGRVDAAVGRHAAQRRNRRLAGGGALTAAVVALGVGVVPVPGGGGDELVGVAAASEATSATSFRFETIVEGMGQRVTAEGAVDPGAEEGRFATTSPLPFLGGGGEGGEGGGEVEVLLDGGTVYVRLPAVGPIEGVLGDAEWLGVDLETAGFAEGITGSIVEPLTAVDPSRALELLTEAGAEVVEDGEEDVRGTPTTRYRIVLDGEQASEHGFGADEVAGRAWVGDDGLLRRVELAYAGPMGAAEVTTDLFDFGVEVDVEAPPADDVTRVDDLLGG